MPATFRCHSWPATTAVCLETENPEEFGGHLQAHREAGDRVPPEADRWVFDTVRRWLDDRTSWLMVHVELAGTAGRPMVIEGHRRDGMLYVQRVDRGVELPKSSTVGAT